MVSLSGLQKKKFLKNQGNLKSLQTEQGISYPAAKKKLNDLLVAINLVDNVQPYSVEDIDTSTWKINPQSSKASDIVKAIALGADACYVASAPLIAMGCHMCQTCNTGKCNWGIATQRPDLTRRLNPEIAHKRVINLINAWNHEIKEIMGGMGINSIDSLRGNRLMLRGIGLSDKELEILGIKHAGE